MSIRRRKRKFSKLSEVILLGDSVGLFPALGVGSTRWDSALGRGKGQRGGGVRVRDGEEEERVYPVALRRVTAVGSASFMRSAWGVHALGLCTRGATGGKMGPGGPFGPPFLLRSMPLLILELEFLFHMLIFLKKNCLLLLLLKLLAKKKNLKGRTFVRNVITYVFVNKILCIFFF